MLKREMTDSNIVSKERTLHEYKELPYTLIGHTSLPTSFTITLSGKGIKKIVDQMQEDETLQITIHGDNKWTDFKILPNHKPTHSKENSSE